MRTVLVGMTLLAAVGCTAKQEAAPLPSVAGGGPTGTSGTASGSATATPGGSTAPGVNRADPVAVYRAWWGAVQVALATGSPDSPDLATYALDPILANTRAGLARLHDQGLVQVVAYTLAPKVVTREKDRVEITDCIIAPAGTYRDAATGKPRAPTGFRNDTPTRDSLRFVLRPRAGDWYLVATTALGGGPC